MTTTGTKPWLDFTTRLAHFIQNDSNGFKTQCQSLAALLHKKFAEGTAGVITIKHPDESQQISVRAFKSSQLQAQTMALPTPTTWPQSVCCSGLKKDSGAKPCNLAIHGATSRESAIPLPLHIQLNTMQVRLQICCQVCEEEVCLASSESTPSIYASAYCEGCRLFGDTNTRATAMPNQRVSFIVPVKKNAFKKKKSASATLDSSLLIFARSLRKQFLALSGSTDSRCYTISLIKHQIGIKMQESVCIYKVQEWNTKCKNEILINIMIYIYIPWSSRPWKFPGFTT